MYHILAPNLKISGAKESTLEVELPDINNGQQAMAPTRTIKSKIPTKNGKKSAGSGKPGPLGANTKGKVSKKTKGPPPKQQKTKSAAPTKKKKRVYTEKELRVPSLNMITPVGVELPKGKKKGKVFVDDQVGVPRFAISGLLI